MILHANFIRNIQRDLDASVTPKIEAYNEPSFATGDVGTLHGARTDANGYKFLRIRLFGSPAIKVVKGCKITFSAPGTEFSLTSDTKDIESYYSKTIQKGITEFEIYLKEEDLVLLKQRVEKITLDFGKSSFFKRLVFDFNVDSKKFASFF